MNGFSFFRIFFLAQIHIVLLGNFMGEWQMSDVRIEYMLSV
jgi:hypothetical protein